VVTDPVWSDRCSPVQFAGPARFRPPGVKFEDLPKVDVVVISHNHYDHLDKSTILDLIEKHDPIFVVPLGLDHLIKKWGATKIHSFDWWDKQKINSLNIQSVPANHFTSRGTFDRDQTLWCGYILNMNGHKIYFAGDTGYGDVFKEIGNRIGAIDVSLIPIGAYLPRWFMSPIHVSPKESVLIHKDVNSKHSIGMHFGTFALENIMITPIEELRKRNDAYINNMLQQKSQHSKEHLQAATLIFEERGLANPKKQELIKQYPALRKEIQQKYKEGMSAKDLVDHMMSKGVSLQDTKEMINKAVQKEQKEFEKEAEKKKNKSLIIAIILGIAYVAFRIFIRMNR